MVYHPMSAPVRKNARRTFDLIAFEALVWATWPGSGSWKTRLHMAERSSRLTIDSSTPVFLAMSVNDTRPPSGT